jgi:hypothetical protein
MWGKLLVGLGALLGIYLLIRNLFRSKEAPTKIENSFNKVFDRSDYKATKQNWLDVSRMETAGWTSNLFLNGNNLWGMKVVKKRPTTQIPFTQAGTPGRNSTIAAKLFPNITEAFTGTPDPGSGSISNSITPVWGKYATIDKAVEDIILWMQYTKFPNRVLSLREHIQEMKNRGYFAGEDVATYFNKVVAWKNRA